MSDKMYVIMDEVCVSILDTDVFYNIEDITKALADLIDTDQYEFKSLGVYELVPQTDWNLYEQQSVKITYEKRNKPQ